MASKNKKPKAVSLPIAWHYPEGLMPRYATNLVVQYGEHECNVSFFEIKPPIFLGTDEENTEALSKMTSVRAECVARIIVAPGRLAEFVNAMQVAIERHQGTKSEKKETRKEDSGGSNGSG